MCNNKSVKDQISSEPKTISKKYIKAFVILRHPVTILVTDFTNPNNFTNDLLILNPLDNKLKQSDGK